MPLALLLLFAVLTLVTGLRMAIWLTCAPLPSNDWTIALVGLGMLISTRIAPRRKRAS